MRSLSNALLSVFDKTGLIDFARHLNDFQIRLVASGGTAAALIGAGLPVTAVETVTGQPEMLDGRVKTLHPALHGGILARLDDPAHEADLAAHGIARIDLVVVNFYDFESGIARGLSAAQQIEQIDIGGPAMARAAAKNHAAVTVASHPDDYAEIAHALHAHGGCVPADLRRQLAGRCFARTAAYEAAIARWFSDGAVWAPRLSRVQDLRYGENPHQAASLWRWADGADTPHAAPGEAAPAGGLAAGTVLQGKALSYNNLLDADRALALAAEFADTGRWGAAAVIVKHGNPCGVAVAETLVEAFTRAQATDPVSAFGGVLAFNQPLDHATASALVQHFAEVVVAPSVAQEARVVLATRPNLRVVEVGDLAALAAGRGPQLRSIAGGVLVQEADRALSDPADWQLVAGGPLEDGLRRDLAFAEAVAKHTNSNAIVLAADGATWGIGAGQMSRVDSTRLAAQKLALAFGAARPARLVLASDAFFPFPDGIEQAAEAGVVAVLQPGGSVRDGEVIEAARRLGLTMVLTGQRHFRH